MNSTETSSIAANILKYAHKYLIIAGFITVSLNIIGNVINMLVFISLRNFRTNRCVFYLIIESISDIIYANYYLVYILFTIFYPTDITATSIIWCRLQSVLVQSCALITNFSIASMAVDQFFSTNHHLIIRQICTVKLAHYLACSMIITFLIHSIIFCFFLNIVPSFGCIISNKSMIKYATYFFYPIFVTILPITIAALFSALAYRNVRHIIRLQLPIERRQFDQQITAMILLRVICFVCFISPYIVYRIYVINLNISSKDSLDYATIQLVQILVVSLVNLNYTVNFYLFFISSERYRRQVKDVLKKQIWNRWKCRCCVKRNTVQPQINISTHMDSVNE